MMEERRTRGKLFYVLVGIVLHVLTAGNLGLFVGSTVVVTKLSHVRRN
jgi:hypothetical protein